MSEARALRRSITFPGLLLYGLGTTVGAGVYALVGEVAGLSGAWAPHAFVFAALLATATAVVLAELAARHPKAAGEAVYVDEAFGRSALTLAIGAAVALAGTISAAAVTVGFAGYASTWIAAPDWMLTTLLLATLGVVAAWGIRESIATAAALTVIEIGGLLAVVAVVSADGVAPIASGAIPADPLPVGGLLSGATLAFYAFLGFEDMVNVAEEVEDVRRTLPRAIVWTLVITAILYALVTLSALAALPLGELRASKAPLADAYAAAVGRPAVEISLIGSLAMINGALIQILMASRVLYGLSRNGLLPGLLGAVHPRTSTPVVATATVCGVVLALALFLPLATLARGTALIALGVFTAIHASLFVLHRRPGPAPAWSCPRWVPVVGGSISVVLIVVETLRLLRGAE